MKFGIIGCGKIGEKRAETIGKNLVGCFDKNKEAGEKFSKKYGCTHFLDLADIFKEVDALVISTSNDAIHNIAKMAIEEGIHVLLEKPAGTNSFEIMELYKRSLKYGVIVRVGFNHRYHPSIMQAKDLVNKGEIGDLMFIRANYGHGGRIGYDKEWRAFEENGGGEMMDQGVHLIDLASYFFDKSPFSQIQGKTKTYYWDMEVEDNGFMVLENENGQTAFLNVSCTEWKNEFSFDIYGRTGRISIKGLGGSYGPEKITIYKMKPEMGIPSIRSFEYHEKDNSWQKEMNFFISDIMFHNLPSANLLDAYSAVKVVETIKGIEE